MANPTLARLSDRALDAVMAIAEVPLNFIERLIGKRRMPYIFLMPN
ncbi:MAG: sugar ABC transporter permease, partial [Agrobacterium fabrum]